MDQASQVLEQNLLSDGSCKKAGVIGVVKTEKMIVTAVAEVELIRRLKVLVARILATPSGLK
jgi:hypothetical protein